MERDTQKLWQLTKSLRGAEQHCNPQMELSQEKQQQTSLPEFLKKRAQLHPQLTRVTDVRTQTRAVLQNTASAGSDQRMTECLTLQELEEALTKTRQKKAPGPDGITNEMLKHLGPGAKPFLLHIYNQSWLTGTVPTIWKEALIRPIPKDGRDNQDPTSYCLSLLSCVGKLLKRIINKRLTWHLESNSVLAPTHTGHWQFKSMEDQLALLTQDTEEAFQEKKVLAVFFDLSKAFDKVWKEELLLKVLLTGAHGKMYKWLCNGPSVMEG